MSQISLSYMTSKRKITCQIGRAPHSQEHVLGKIRVWDEKKRFERSQKHILYILTN